MNVTGSGFVTIVNYGSYAESEVEQFVILTENGNNLLTESGQDLLIEASN